MPNSSNSSNPAYSVICLLGIALLSCTHSPEQSSSRESGVIPAKEAAMPRVDTVEVLTENRLSLTRQYAKVNYGIDDYHLVSPKMIVVHYTAIPTLEETLDYFKPDSLESSRTNIIKKSPLNVGVQYVVDYDGRIYHLLPDSVMGRHLIGFNHVALGIENVAGDSSQLTEEQLISNVRLIKFLSDKYPSVKYVIGHQEYSDKTLPHYRLLIANDPSYQPYPKPDPGDDFLQQLRSKLKADYGLEFER